LGTHQHLAVDIDLTVAPNGGLRLRSGKQRLYEGAIGFSFPMLFSGIAEVCESYDDTAGCFRIEVSVRNSVWGPLFGYNGSFQVEPIAVSADRIPPERGMPSPAQWRGRRHTGSAHGLVTRH